MHWTRFSIIAITSFLITIGSVVFKKSIALSICSILTFNSVTCHANFGDASRVNAAAPPNKNEVEQSLSDVSEGQEVADICLFGACAPIDLPSPVEDVIEGGLNNAAKRKMRSLLADEIPIRGSEHEFYKNVANPPGGAFTPQLLTLSALSPDTPIPPGDYEIPAHFYCTKIYSFDGRGNRFTLARLNGQMSDVLAALYTRASYDSSISTSEVQTLSWAIQTGMSYGELSDSQRKLVDRLIPEYRDRMEKSFIDRLTGIVNNVSRISGNRLPGVNQILDDLGPVGDIASTLLRAREQVLRTNYSYQALAQEFAPQKDVFLDGGTEETPWSRVLENVYMRFIAPDGALDDGTVQVRILGNSSSKLNQQNQSIMVASLLSYEGIASNTTSGVTAETLTQNITQSVGVPESSGNQAITASLPPSQESAQPPCNDNQIQASYDTSSDKYHSYTVENEVCSTASPGCTRDFVFTTMVSEVQFIAPTSETTPVTNCKITILNIPGPFGEDPIITSVNQNQYSTTNYTRTDHALHPGRVTRTIIERNGKIIVVTFGEGTGILPNINERMASKLWTDVDNKLIEEVRQGLSTR